MNERILGMVCWWSGGDLQNIFEFMCAIKISLNFDFNLNEREVILLIAVFNWISFEFTHTVRWCSCSCSSNRGSLSRQLKGSVCLLVYVRRICFIIEFVFSSLNTFNEDRNLLDGEEGWPIITWNLKGGLSSQYKLNYEAKNGSKIDASARDCFSFGSSATRKWDIGVFRVY